MTPEERNMLADLANKIAQTPAPPKDADAEDFIRKSIGSRPDALYLMTQTVLIQNMALQQSQRQIQDLQQRLSQPVPAASGGYAGGGGSFLGSGGQAAPPPQQQFGQPQYAQPQAQYGAPAAAPPSAMGGFLRGAAQTAAGVAAGTLAVQGIESLFSHHGGGFGGSGLFGGGGGGYAPGETVIENNYYGDPAEGSRHERFADGGNADGGNSVADDLAPPDNTDYDDDSSQVDDSSYDDSSANDDNFS